MESSFILDLARETLWVSLKLGLPILLVALIVGLVVSLLQALTQIQEMTLSFVPKMIAVFGALWLLMPMMARWLSQLAERVFEHILRV